MVIFHIGRSFLAGLLFSAGLGIGNEISLPISLLDSEWGIAVA